MTIQEFASKSQGSAIMRIVLDGSLLMIFDTEYWQYIRDDILDLEIESFAINNQLMKKAEVTVNIGTVTDPDDDDYDDDFGDAEPEDDPADDFGDEDPADNLGDDTDDGDDGDDGGDEP